MGPVGPLIATMASMCTTALLAGGLLIRRAGSRVGIGTGAAALDDQTGLMHGEYRADVLAYHSVVSLVENAVLAARL